MDSCYTCRFFPEGKCTINMEPQGYMAYCPWFISIAKSFCGDCKYFCDRRRCSFYNKKVTFLQPAQFCEDFKLAKEGE